MAGLAILKHTFEQAMLAAGLIVGIGCCVGHVVDHVPSHLSCAEFWSSLGGRLFVFLGGFSTVSFERTCRIVSIMARIASATR